MATRNILSGLSLRVLVATMTGSLIVLTLAFAGRLDQNQALERYSLMGVGLLLVLTVLTAFVFFLRLSALRAILRRLDDLLERYFHNTSTEHPAWGNDECAQIGFALQLLEESLEARERSERDLRWRGRISASILKALHQSVIVSDSRGNVILFSQGAEAMLGYSADEIIGKETPMLFHDLGEVRRRAEELTEELCIPVVADTYTLVAKALATSQVDEREWTYIRKDGTRLTVLLSITVFFDDDDNIMCCCVATDITERSRYAAEILHLANFDPLTQLPNRRLFHDRIYMAITQARRKSAKFGLLMIDLDRFKPVNDKYGHSVGDLLLGAVAGRMQKCLRESDTLERIGGDEFVAILPTIRDAADARGVAKKLRLSLCQPFELTGDVTVSIDCSIGIAIYPDHGGDEDSLLKNSDDAMYVAKGQGRTKIYFAGSGADAENGDGDGGSGDSDVSRDGDPLVWRSAYQCGEKTIDWQHKSVFVLCNSIICAAENGGASLDRLPEMLDKLVNEIVTHCRYEESVLSHYAYPDIDALNQKHQALFERVQDLSCRFLAREAQVGEVIASIRQCVTQHMLTEDHEFYAFLKKMLQQQDQTDPA
jgi:diguanylate cyclase (GGDEF)-like protein/hemerythrin-like metal-binding protein/PAS domain S-box-containing protein